jgi:hypothetical protein
MGKMAALNVRWLSSFGGIDRAFPRGLSFGAANSARLPCSLMITLLCERLHNIALMISTICYRSQQAVERGARWLKVVFKNSSALMRFGLAC